ncbi:histidine phosphatase family protein [bacterium]|nr:histidine phosphatase family protein [bacterium]
MPLIYLARHGESEANLGSWISSWTDVSLTLKGQEDAALLAEDLKKNHFEGILSSDLKRAKETAAIIAARLNLEHQTTSGLRERNFGIYTGRTFKQMEQKHSREWRRIFEDKDAAPEGGESLEQLQNRAVEALNSYSRHWKKCYLVISHFCTIGSLLGYLDGKVYNKELVPYKTKDFLTIDWKVRDE